MTPSACACRTCEILAETADCPWLSHVRFSDVIRVIVAWDRLTQCVPDGRHPVDYLDRHTHGLSRRLLDDLRLTRHACAHPHTRPRSQQDLDRALVTAFHAIAQLRE
ncbi:hypothetical protein [Streptomyces sp. NRRL F-5123]|uniref:hypothetical protein n=1 Tax=Streptomyces sp. NRRL F-5123 TaxID=1463856 RepID=UPI0004E18A33|nr:hypothetical protein [Streptomyces sp. NRRL F-5123]